MSEVLQAWWDMLSGPGALRELGLLAASLGLAWLFVWALRKAMVAKEGEHSILLGRKLYDGVLFPLALTGLVLVSRALLISRKLPVMVLEVALPLLVALVVIRVGVKVLQATFQDRPWARALERSISWMVWLLLVLWFSGVLEGFLEEMEGFRWKVGSSYLSVRTLLEGAVTAGAVLLMALWVSSAIETRLLRESTGNELSLRKAISNAVRVLLMFLGLMIALSTVGIDLTALSVLGGAIGVGIGFGLQKLAANYVSGFVILAERSMRIGDSVKVDGFEGRITDIRGRYTVIRSLGGRESIVPNEMLITQRVENYSLADSRLWQGASVSVAYDSDVDQVMALMLAAAKAQPRVLADPPPGVNMMAFGADGLEFRVGYWLADPENGLDGVRSDINRVILQSFREHGIEIPYPQRVLHMPAGGVPPLAMPEAALLPEPVRPAAPAELGKAAMRDAPAIDGGH